MTDQDLAEKLARVATEMVTIADAMHARGSEVDASGDWHWAYRYHRHAREIKNAAKIARKWAIEISREAAA